MEKKKTKILSLIIALALVLGILIPTVLAVDLTQTTGSLTITKYEVNNGTQSVLAGVTFAIYKIDDDSESTETPSGDPVATATTGSDGVVTFSDLALGRYLVVEVSAPSNVVSKIANFIVDIPMTSDDGTSLIYDVEVYPKNNTVYGGIGLTKYDSDGVTTLDGVTFELQQYDETTTSWSTVRTLTTADGGLITVEGLAAGTYRFVETSTLDGYILDNSETYEFKVYLDSSENTVVSPESFTVTNDHPSLTKEVTSTTDGSVNIGDTVSYKLTATVPSTITNLKTYTIQDTFSGGLTYTASTANIVVKGVTSGGTSTTLKLNTDYTVSYDSGTSTLTIDFTTANLGNYATIEVTYDLTLNRSGVTGSDANTNSAGLVYSTVVTTNYDGDENDGTGGTPDSDDTSTTDEDNSDSVDITTGGFYIEKTNSSGDLLSGAVFKIAATESDAEAGNYLTDENGDEIELTTSNGYASYLGLAYGTYYLVEVQAPSYTSGDDTKYYNLLTSPVEIEVTSTTYAEGTDTQYTIVNKKGFSLPDTGGIGTIIITIVGLVIIASGVVVYRKGNKEN